MLIACHINYKEVELMKNRFRFPSFHDWHITFELSIAKSTTTWQQKIQMQLWMEIFLIAKSTTIGRENARSTLRNRVRNEMVPNAKIQLM